MSLRPSDRPQEAEAKHNRARTLLSGYDEVCDRKLGQQLVRGLMDSLEIVYRMRP